ncbi:prolyl oligopeptidase family serine peptidase [Streptomyces sp. NPDC007856]|uniref:S9 family peptidase n=1 Tax=Streptomyces sp. NPDC007856 TaxID=3364781 RepID=UPI0036AAFD7C
MSWDVTGYRLLGDVELSPDGARVAFTLKEPAPARDRWVSSIRVTGTSAPGEASEQVGPAGAASPRWSPCGRALAYLAKPEDPSDGPLWVQAEGGAEARALLPGFRGVSQISWSPDGRRIAFVAPVTASRQPVRGSAAPPAVIRRLTFKADGIGLLGDSRLHLHVVDVETGEVRQLTRGDFDVRVPSWSHDGRRICFSSAMHDGREIDRVTHPFILDLADDSVRQAADWAGTASWTGWDRDGRSLILAGQHRPGPNRLTTLFRVGLDDASVTDLLPDFDRRVLVPSSGGPGAVIQTDRGDLVFCARERGCTWLYRLPAGETVPQPLVAGPSTVVTAVSPARNGKLLALAVSDRTNAGDVHLLDPADMSPRRLTDLNPGQDPDTIHAAEDFAFRSPSGTVLHGYLIRGVPAADGAPPPLLVDIHGGPDNAWRPNFSPYYLYRQELADRGWTILLLNPRGSDGYGEGFMRSGMTRLGFSEEEDFLAAIDHLVEQGSADPERIAVMGSSHGGFMTNWLTARTDRFAAAVSTACVSNWLSLYGTSSTGSGFVIEQMGGSPYDVPARYTASSPLTYADRVRTPTLIVHGEQDMLNPIGQSEEWYTALVRQGCEVEFVRYPQADHLFMYNGRLSHQVDYARRVVDWLLEHTRNEKGWARNPSGECPHPIGSPTAPVRTRP